MGININAGLSSLIKEHHSYKDFSEKKALMLGVQDMDIKGIDVINYLCAFDYEYSPRELTNKRLFREFDSYLFFKLLGFSEVDAMDVSDYEGASIIHDLNDPVNSELYEKYDLIYDGGTTEHVFNVPQVLNNIGNMLKPNGVVIHDLPAANWCNHGFYTFSPTFFLEYYSQNSYEVKDLFVFNYNGGYSQEAIQYRSVDCRGFDVELFLRKKLDVDNERALVCCVAKKKENSQNKTVPIQGLYQNLFSGATKYEIALRYVTQLIGDKYQNIGIYGTGINAKSLYNKLKTKGCNVCLIRGGSKEDVGSLYVIKDLSVVQEDMECIVIGSFDYADLIENRLRNELDISRIKLINMLDV